jgi:predicted transposase YbfD/YdcC
MENKIKIIENFENVKCKQEHNGYKCNVGRTLLIVILGSVCGLRNVSLIHEWATNPTVKAFLWEHFDVYSIPCQSWFRKLLKIVVPESLNECFINWVKTLLPKSMDDLTLSVDGKAIRSTFKNKNCNESLHIVNAHLAEWGLTMGQKAVDAKSNEIPAMRELIGMLEIQGCVVVADALNCQTKTAAAIIEAKADYVLTVKDNQETLKNDIENHIQNNKLSENMDISGTEEANHGRKEIRIAYATNDLSEISNVNKWREISSIGAINRLVFNSKGELLSDEWHYYISSKNLSAEDLLRYARNEWTVETMHWFLDVHFGEDYCKIEDIDVQKNLNIIRKIALNIIKTYKTNKISKKPVSKIMLNSLIDCGYLLDVVSAV